MLCDQLLHTLERCADPAFALTVGGELWTWNPAAESLFGYLAPEALHRPVEEVLRPRGPLGVAINEAYCARAARDGYVAAFDMQVTTRTGRRIWIGVSVLVFQATHTMPTMIVHLAHDITADKRREKLVSRYVDIARKVAAASDESQRLVPVNPLSEQEGRILRALGDGKTPAEIAQAVGISAQTLRNHLHHVNQKLGTHNRLEAVIHATRRKLI
jgi:PAS domain S-box-containing protein